MKTEKKGLLALRISIISYFLMSASFLLMPVTAMGYFPGMMFWGCLLTGVVTQVILEKNRCDFFKSYRVDRRKMQKPRCGALTFRSNRAATTVDYLLPVCVVILFAAVVLTNGEGYICYVCVALTVFLFIMHCILNGRNYFHVINQNRIRQVLEKKKATTLDKGEGDHDKK